MPGINHTVHPDEERTSVGAKWSASGNKAPGQYSTQGVVNTVNHNLGGTSDYGTDAEVGLKFHF